MNSDIFRNIDPPLRTAPISSEAKSKEWHGTSFSRSKTNGKPTISRSFPWVFSTGLSDLNLLEGIYIYILHRTYLILISIFIPKKIKHIPMGQLAVNLCVKMGAMFSRKELTINIIYIEVSSTSIVFQKLSNICNMKHTNKTNIYECLKSMCLYMD